MILSVNTDFVKLDAVIAEARFRLTNTQNLSPITKAAFGAPFLICRSPAQTENDCRTILSGISPVTLPALVPDKDYLIIVLKQEYQQHLHEIQHTFNQPERTEISDCRDFIQEINKHSSQNHFQTVSPLMDIIRKKKGLVTVNQLHSEAAISLRHLRRIVNQYCDQSLKEIITMERLKQAFIFIASGMSVERALFIQHFYDFSHFSKTCQKYLSAKPHQLVDSDLFMKMIELLYNPHSS